MKKIDNFDNCIIGIIERCSQPNIICYDRDAIIKQIISEEQMTLEEAIEHFEFNIKGAWIGEDTPCFLQKTLSEELIESLNVEQTHEAFYKNI